MRNLFLMLLLANLLVLGWQMWIVPPEVPADHLPRAGNEKELVLTAVGRTTAAGAKAAVTATGATSDARAGGAQCLRIGPMADGGIADAVGQRLQGEGITVSQASEEGQVWVGHWVQIEKVANREEADKIVGRLSAGGLPDAYVLQAAGPTAISLGVFRSRERADKVAADARRLGFQPTVTDRYRVGVQYWLQARVPPGGRLKLAELARETGQILRSEYVACAPGGVGGSAGFN